MQRSLATFVGSRRQCQQRERAPKKARNWDNEVADKASDGARRARRGYRFQDLHTLGRYFDCLEGDLMSVSAESDEDVTCVRPDGAIRYEQVKTVEEPTQLWSLASVCKKEKGQADRSILGRLYSTKPLPDGSSFVLVFNENVNDSLRVFKQAPQHRTATDMEQARTDISAKLDGVSPSDERDVAWCVDRTSVQVVERTAAALERELRDRLNRVVQSTTGDHLLPDELDDVLERLITQVEAEARADHATIVDGAEVTNRVQSAVSDCMRPFLTSPPAEGRLRSKLEAAGLTEPAIEQNVEMYLAFRSSLRNASIEDRERLRLVTEDVYLVCNAISQRRLAGLLAPGIDSYQATIDATLGLYASDYASSTTDRPTLIRALHDITSRCRNTYV